MNANFIKRNACPCCGITFYSVIHSTSFTDGKIWPFLTSYYEGRVPKEKLESQLFNVARCNNCGLLFQEYILNDSNMYLLYEEWISAEKSRDKKMLSDISLYKKYAAEIESICEFFNKKPHEINVLEYGMGWGYWSNMATAYNYRVTGVEISKARLEFARRSDLRVIEDTAHEESSTYDYIYSNQVLEHVPDPKKTIQELARILRKKGIIHLQVPDGRGIEKELRNPNWRAKKDAIHPLEHINCFNRKSLKVLAGQAGLSLRAPVYRSRSSSLIAYLRGYGRYLNQRFWSTEVFLTKN